MVPNVSYLNVSAYNSYSFNLSVQGVTKNGTIASAFAADWQASNGGQSSAPLPASHSDPFVTFCLDLDTWLASGWWKSGGFSDVPLTTDQSPLVRQGLDSLQYAAQLYTNNAGGIMAANGSWLDKAKGAALQLAIWEVLYEYDTTGGFNVMSGSGFKVTSASTAVTVAAQNMLTGLSYGNPDINLNTTFWNATDKNGNARSNQDLIGPFQPVPEPTTVIAGALLLLPFLASTLRRKVRS